MDVLVLERRHVVGGAAVTEELVPGFKFSRGSYLAGLLRPQIIEDLDLEKYGFKYEQSGTTLVSVSSLARPLCLYSSDDLSLSLIFFSSPPFSSACLSFCCVFRYFPFLSPVYFDLFFFFFLCVWGEGRGERGTSFSFERKCQSLRIHATST